MTTAVMNWMKKSINILVLALALLGSAACQSNRKCNSPVGTELSPMQAQIDSLSARIVELEGQNAAQEERIKDLEDDLEGVMAFLNEQGY